MTYPTGKYFATVTEFGCIPVSIVYQDKRFGWTLIRLVHMVTIKYFSEREIYGESADDVIARHLFTSYMNNMVGISDPNLLNPPPFCPGLDAEVDSREEPVDFMDVFF